MTKRKDPKDVLPRGRKTRYKKEFDEQVYQQALLGKTLVELGKYFGVSDATIKTWKNKHPTFLASLKAGKDKADAKVAESLYQRALGYSHPEDKIYCHDGEVTVVPTTKHYPPDATSAIFWLKNRQRGKWTDRTEVEVGGDVKLVISAADAKV